MVFIYILELENNKYYVGKTTLPDFRIDQHLNSNGSQWTKKYKPIKVLQIIPNCDNYDEDKYTLKCMEQYGINNVRGGTFCQIKLTNDNLLIIQKMINGSTDKCYICGEAGHFAKKCSQFKSKNKLKIPTIDMNEKCDCVTSMFSSHRRGKCLINKVLTYFDDEDDDDNINNINLFIGGDNKSENLIIKVNSCNICGREGHTDQECYAKTTILGDKIQEIEVFCCSYCDKEFDTLKGATCHENLYCKNKNTKKTKNTKITVKKNKCYRCGRDGHYSSDCYAEKHVNGKYLD